MEVALPDMSDYPFTGTYRDFCNIFGIADYSEAISE
jgi:hypothetical protein